MIRKHERLVNKLRIVIRFFDRTKNAGRSGERGCFSGSIVGDNGPVVFMKGSEEKGKLQTSTVLVAMRHIVRYRYTNMCICIQNDLFSNKNLQSNQQEFKIKICAKALHFLPSSSPIFWIAPPSSLQLVCSLAPTLCR